VYSPARHYLPLGEITDRLMGDNLWTQVAYAKAVMAAKPESRWASVNANHMLPSGSSLFHPHLQGIVDPEPTTVQRGLAGVPAARFAAYLDAERRCGERHLGRIGRVEWLVSFAPIAPAEVRAFVSGVASPAELDDESIAELAHGLVHTLNGYAEMGYESFNLATYGAPPGTNGYSLNLRIACRSNLGPHYRSDSTFLERLHWEGARGGGGATPPPVRGLAPAAHVVDPERSDFTGFDRAHLLGFVRPRQVGEQVRPATAPNAIEAAVEFAHQGARAVQTVLAGPSRQVVVPLQARGQPALARAVKPPLGLVCRVHSVKAPARARLVEALPIPHDHDDRAVPGEHVGDPVDDGSGIAHMMQ